MTAAPKMAFEASIHFLMSKPCYSRTTITTGFPTGDFSNTPPRTVETTAAEFYYTLKGGFSISGVLNKYRDD